MAAPGVVQKVAFTLRRVHLFPVYLNFLFCLRSFLDVRVDAAFRKRRIHDKLPGKLSTVSTVSCSFLEGYLQVFFFASV